jgi:hypothetical protein
MMHSWEQEGDTDALDWCRAGQYVGRGLDVFTVRRITDDDGIFMTNGTNCCRTELHRLDQSSLVFDRKNGVVRADRVNLDGSNLTSADDMVNLPPHYTSHPSGVECIQITEHMGFTLGNAVKYLWRADLKGGTEDLKKAAWYIQREIEKRGEQ